LEAIRHEFGINSHSLIKVEVSQSDIAHYVLFFSQKSSKLLIFGPNEFAPFLFFLVIILHSKLHQVCFKVYFFNHRFQFINQKPLLVFAIKVFSSCFWNYIIHNCDLLRQFKLSVNQIRKIGESKVESVFHRKPCLRVLEIVDVGLVLLVQIFQKQMNRKGSSWHAPVSDY
jgi:hypothetical protein